METVLLRKCLILIPGDERECHEMPELAFALYNVGLSILNISKGEQW
jgi:hypothetical protein